MVVVLLTTVFVGVLIYRRIKKRRARKRAMKLAAAARTVSSPVAVDAAEERFPNDEVIIIVRTESPSSHPHPSSPPPYSTPSSHPYLNTNRPVEYPGTYARDKPPPYSRTVAQVQNS